MVFFSTRKRSGGTNVIINDGEIKMRMLMYVVIYVTAKDLAEGQKIAHSLVEQKLVACVNIVKDVQSVFSWEGKIDSSSEVLLVMKSRKALMPRIIRAVKMIHSYQLPEIIALPIVGGSREYLNWITRSTK